MAYKTNSKMTNHIFFKQKPGKVYYLKPLLANNKSKRGLALDGQLKHENSNLASFRPSLCIGCLDGFSIEWWPPHTQLFFVYIKISFSFDLNSRSFGFKVKKLD